MHVRRIGRAPRNVAMAPVTSAHVLPSSLPSIVVRRWSVGDVSVRSSLLMIYILVMMIMIDRSFVDPNTHATATCAPPDGCTDAAIRSHR